MLTEFNNTRTPENLDRFDYFIAALKQRGIAARRQREGRNKELRLTLADIEIAWRWIPGTIGSVSPRKASGSKCGQ